MPVHTTQTLLGLVPVAAATGIATKAVKGIGSKKNTRKFGGKAYKVANWHTTKAVAERDADYFRKAGHSARVAKSYNTRMKKWGYMVYVR